MNAITYMPTRIRTELAKETTDVQTWELISEFHSLPEPQSDEAKSWYDWAVDRIEQLEDRVRAELWS